ncbi:MAG: restriction endonuclease, SacI family [Candidatus Dormiibacterota bacterium]
MKIDRARALAAFTDAYRMASTSAPLPTEWTERLELLATERTYTAVLVTALLARAVTPDAQPRVLMVRAGMSGYSARGLFTHVVFEECKRLDIPLGTIGREPHNNQPFFGQAEIDDVVRSRVDTVRRPIYDRFVDDIDAAGELTSPQALLAFACFLRLRMKSDSRVRLVLDTGAYDLSVIRGELPTFVLTGNEGGRRGEAFVAACLDLWYEHVRVNIKANDPSRNLAGDVAVFQTAAAMASLDPKGVLFLSEVKEREATDGEMLQFAENVATRGIRRAFYFLLSPAQAAVDLQSVADEVWRRHAVSIAVLAGINQIFTQAITLAETALDEAITEFLRQMAHRLDEKEAESGLVAWRSLVERLTRVASET